MCNESFKHSIKLPYHDSLGLAVYNCGFQRCDPGHSWGPAVRDHYLIHYITAGKGWYDSGKKRYELTAGDGFLVVPSSVVSYRADDEDPWEYHWVGFNGTDANRLVSLAGLTQETPIFHYRRDGLYRDKLLNIYRLNGAGPSDEVRMQAELLLFLAALIDNADTPEHPHRSGYEYVKKSLRFIDYNYSRDIDVDDIAANAGISRSHLYRLFMQHLSIPPNEYLTRYRIQKACVLLKSQNLSVGEAAYSTGFSDQLYFSRVFKKYKGVPPSRWSERKDGDKVPSSDCKSHV
jgi:AraC-like DNA-binding protein